MVSFVILAYTMISAIRQKRQENEIENTAQKPTTIDNVV